MTADGRKGLELSWNLLNLADSAAMHGSSLTYAWLSDGTKVAAKADDGSGNGVVKRYLGPFVYSTSGGSSTEEPTDVESVAWDEGRIFFDIPEAVPEEYIEDPDLDPEPEINPDEPEQIEVWFPYRDCWFAGDHLGNVRTVIDITPDLSAPQVLEQSDYLPFGTRIQNPDFISGMNNRWRYAGKEEQRFGLAGAFSPAANSPFSDSGSLDLSLLDFGARMYDPFVARWTAVDPLASKYQGYSPYNYCLENPIIHQDTDGRIVANIIGAAIGAATEVTMQVIAQKVSGASFKEAVKNIDYLDVGVAAAEGFITAGTSAIKNTAVKATARLAISTASAAVAGKFDCTSENGLTQNSNLQAVVSAVSGLVAGSANFSGKARQVLKPKSNSAAVNAAREVAHQEGQSFSAKEAKNIAAKNEARNAYVKSTNEGTKDAVNSTKNSVMELPNYIFWEKAKDD